MVVRMRRVAGGVFGLASAFLLGACTVIGVRSGTEQPRYAVVERLGPIEIRRYEARLAAETVVEGPEEEARSAGFRTLAAYIFGANRPAANIAMTAPVEQQRIAMTAPVEQQRIAMTAPVVQQRIAMTAPVEQQALVPQGGRTDGAAATQAWRIRFFMPARWTAESLPLPADPAIAIATLPPETVAVLCFSGVPRPEAVARQRDALLRALADSPWRADGPLQDWFYDPPWTLPAARRNEVAVRVVPRGA